VISVYNKQGKNLSANISASEEEKRSTSCKLDSSLMYRVFL